MPVQLSLIEAHERTIGQIFSDAYPRRPLEENRRELECADTSRLRAKPIPHR